MTKLNNSGITYRIIYPDKSLADFVESFWMLQHENNSDKPVIVLPDGRIDLFFTQSATEAFHVTFLGIGTNPECSTVKANRITFAISFKPLASEYILKENISSYLNKSKSLPVNFWDFCLEDLNSFDLFCEKASKKIQSLLPQEIDSRKQKLFELIYASNGALSVKELSETVFWSSRQMNRYFNQQYGISLKAYCNIIRFRASFQHIKEGKLFPEQNFADQAHFIKEVKKMSGVNPKQLALNQNDRFIQFSTLSKK